jgi:hypothetical protein
MPNGDDHNREIRITFNYSHVYKEMPESFLQLLTEVHDYLSNPTNTGERSMAKDWTFVTERWSIWHL